jgi:hypothetical protein
MEAAPEATDAADAWASGAAPAEARTNDDTGFLCAGVEADAEEEAEDDATLVAEFPDTVAAAGGRAPPKDPEWGPRLDAMLILLAMLWQTWQRRERSPPQLETPGQVVLPNGHMQ